MALEPVAIKHGSETWSKAATISKTAAVRTGTLRRAGDDLTL